VTYGLPLQTGADALFVMNYPAYVGESTVDAEYHSSHPGLGYKYTSEQVTLLRTAQFQRSRVKVEQEGSNLNDRRFKVVQI
jgi:hypothetical protein